LEDGDLRSSASGDVRELGGDVAAAHHHFDHAGGLGAFAAEGATMQDGTKAQSEQ
jgi:glyoxylase-like metal-dependent hydrolase (beta-lactamase superfamily II)